MTCNPHVRMIFSKSLKSLMSYFGIDDKDYQLQKSFYGRIPSQDFDVDVYEFYLNHATPEELEEGIITSETIRKIARELK